MTNTSNTPPAPVESNGSLLTKIYLKGCASLAILGGVFGFVDPWLISQNDTFLVIAGFALAAVTLPVMFYIAVSIVRNIKKIHGE